ITHFYFSVCLSSHRSVYTYMLLLPSTSTLFPSTTLFRSSQYPTGVPRLCDGSVGADCKRSQGVATKSSDLGALTVLDGEHQIERSEEHTSELQSRENLVCRLLLEKKKYFT